MADLSSPFPKSTGTQYLPLLRFLVRGIDQKNFLVEFFKNDYRPSKVVTLPVLFKNRYCVRANTTKPPAR